MSRGSRIPVRIVVADDHAGGPRRVRRAARHPAGLHRRRHRPRRRRGGAGLPRAAPGRRADGRPDARRWTASRPPGRSAGRRAATAAGAHPDHFDLDEYVYDALRAGASGFLLKDVTAERLFDAVRVVAAGDALLAPAVTRRLIGEFASGLPSPPTKPFGRGEAGRPTATACALTPRETEVLRLVAEGLSNPEIAARLTSPRRP